MPGATHPPAHGTGLRVVARARAAATGQLGQAQGGLPLREPVDEGAPPGHSHSSKWLRLGPESEEATGAATDREWSPEYLYGTDGTAGAHGRDPRGRIAAWAVVIFKRTPTGVEQIGAACGVLPPGTSVPHRRRLTP